MSKFRYVRMAGNEQGWKRPHSGRLGGEDFVGLQGLGYEDWNFANDLWNDGRSHLYINITPAGFDGGKFNFILGAHAQPVPMILGFVENATHGVSELPENVLRRRAQEIFALSDSVGPLFRGKSVKEISEILRAEANSFRVSVAPQDIHILAQPVPMPKDLYTVTHPGYLPLQMTESQYRSIKERVLANDIMMSAEQEEEVSFPEGRLVEKYHVSRERSREVVKLAKERFIQKHGRLFCEVCGLEPEKHFGSSKMRDRLIEAHHDVALSDERHDGKTKPSELRMVCPTCHRAIHTMRPWLTVDRFKKDFS